MSTVRGWLAALWSWLRGLFRRDPAQDAPVPAGGILRGPRLAALIAIAILVAAASVAAFTESYHGLYEWAGEHGLSGFWQAAFPVQVDVFIAVGELALFVALIDGWRKRDRLGGWLVTLAGVAVSVAGNVGHIATHRLTDRGTAAVPPLAAAAALAVGLGVLKRVVAKRSQQPEPGPAKRRSVVVPDGKLAAARLALEETKKAGNPWPERQLVARFDITRGEAASLYQEFGLKPSPNGVHADA